MFGAHAMPAVERFGEQICTLLDTTPAIDERGGPVRTVLDLSPAARTKRIEVHDASERELGTGGTLYSVRDVAAKAAENAARLAALFHVLQRGISGAIGVGVNVRQHARFHLARGQQPRAHTGETDQVVQNRDAASHWASSSRVNQRVRDSSLPPASDGSNAAGLYGTISRLTA